MYLQQYKSKERKNAPECIQKISLVGDQPGGEACGMRGSKNRPATKVPLIRQFLIRVKSVTDTKRQFLTLPMPNDQK